MSKMTRSEAGKLGAEKTKQIWLDRYARSPSFCKHCESKFPYEKRHNKFCNHSCSASFNNKQLGRRERSIPEVQVCKYCGIRVEDKKNMRKYCSHTCQREHEWQIRKNEITERGWEDSPRCAKRYLKEVRGIKCEDCGTAIWKGEPIMLVMDHIDGNSEDNRLDNLRLLCSNCDAMTSTYKGRNNGNGRHSRRKRYAEGKSY